MITLEKAHQVEGIFEDGFRDLNIGEVFTLGLMEKYPWELTERDLREEKDGLLKERQIKTVDLADPTIELIYRELSQNKKLRNACYNFSLADACTLWDEYFNTNEPALFAHIVGNKDGRREERPAVGPRNSAYHSGTLMRKVKLAESGEYIPAITDNVIAVYQQKAAGRRITGDFKRAYAKELVPLLLAEGRCVLIDDPKRTGEAGNMGKAFYLEMPFGWAKRLAKESEIELPPIYQNMVQAAISMGYDCQKLL